MPPSFNWKHFLVVAQMLSKNPDEASLRSAVSRAYYSAFISALRRAESLGYDSKSDPLGSSHDNLWELYENNRDTTCENIAKIGKRMKRARVGADYRDFFTNRWNQESLDAIKDALECLNLISQLGTGLPADVPRKRSF
jgi:uncharacterized protein (UPF0332 family)